MMLTSLSLQNFRTYKKTSFEFSHTVIIIGDNAIGKTNILEAIYYLSRGKSFRADKDIDTVFFEEDFAKITGDIIKEHEKTTLEVIIARKESLVTKRFLVDGVPKRQLDFVSHFPTTLFTPQDIELLTESPNLRRRFLDSILIQVSKSYRLALMLYEKALKQRNRLLHDIREEKRIFRQEEFDYWNNLLVNNGAVITEQRKRLIDFLTNSEKDLFPFTAQYDHSTFTYERAEKYKDVERATGITVIGPQRDDVVFLFGETDRSVREFCSRGEQRLCILQLKLLEISYLEETLQQRPTLLLDDIYSELDEKNISKITEIIPYQQTFITTTHEEFVTEKIAKNAQLIKLP